MAFYEVEEEILAGMHAFGDTQKVFTGAALRTNFVDPLGCSWYGTAVDERRGAFGFVQEEGGYDDFIGEFLKLTIGDTSVAVYCLGATPQIATPLAITRRCFLEFATLAETAISAYVEVLI